MSRPFLIALRTLLLLLVAGAVLAQVFAHALAESALPATPAIVVAVLTIAGLAGVELVLLCVWVLLGTARDETIFEAGGRSERWVSTAIGALAGGAALAAAGLVYLLVSGSSSTAAGATVTVLAAAVAGAAAALALLVMVMRQLLHTAVRLHSELAEVI